MTSRHVLRHLFQTALQCSEGALSQTCRAASAVASKDGKALHPDLLNDAVKRTEYAVRGELYLRAMELQKEGMKITFTNGAHSRSEVQAAVPCSQLPALPYAAHVAAYGMYDKQPCIVVFNACCCLRPGAHLLAVSRVRAAAVNLQLCFESATPRDAAPTAEHSASGPRKVARPAVAAHCSPHNATNQLITYTYIYVSPAHVHLAH